MAYQDYWKEIAGSIPKLPIPLAQRIVNRSWAEIRDMRMWSFLASYGDLYAPAAITAGTVNLTQFSPTVVPDLTAIAALNAAGQPPLAGVVGVGRQIRIGNSPNFGQVYSIIAYNGSLLTLDRPYAGPTQLSAPYTVYRAYYVPPVADFVRYEAVINVASGYAITGSALQVSWLAERDPQRGSFGDPYALSPFIDNSSGVLVHEFYPHPQIATVFTTYFQRRGADLSNNVDLPPQIPADLLMARCYLHAYDWAAANLALFPELQLTNWIQARQMRQKVFDDRLIQVIKQDDEQMPQLPFRTLTRRVFFPGGEWLQTHALPLR